MWVWRTTVWLRWWSGRQSGPTVSCDSKHSSTYEWVQRWHAECVVQASPLWQTDRQTDNSNSVSLADYSVVELVVTSGRQSGPTVSCDSKHSSTYEWVQRWHAECVVQASPVSWQHLASSPSLAYVVPASPGPNNSHSTDGATVSLYLAYIFYTHNYLTTQSFILTYYVTRVQVSIHLLNIVAEVACGIWQISAHFYRVTYASKLLAVIMCLSVCPSQV